MLLKGPVEPVDQPGPGYYSRLFLVERVTGGWRPVADLSSLKWVHHADEIQDEDGHISPKFNSPGRLDVFCRSQRCIFLDSNPSGISTVSGIQSLGSCVSVPGVVLRSFHGFAGFHQSLCSGFRVGASEGCASPLLPRQQAGGCGVKGTSSSPLGHSSPVVHRSENCHQLGEVEPAAADSSSVSRHDDRHIP